MGRPVRRGDVSPQQVRHQPCSARELGGPNDNVTEFNLIFSLDAIFGNADDVIVNVDSPGFADLDSVVINGGEGLLAQFVRFDVTATAGANPGAAQFVFFTTASLVPEPAGAAVWVIAAGALGIGLIFRRRRR